MDLVNVPRVAAAASKIGNPSHLGHRAAIVGEVLRDVAEEVGGADQSFFVAVKDEMRCKAYDTVALLCGAAAVESAAAEEGGAREG